MFLTACITITSTGLMTQVFTFSILYKIIFMMTGGRDDDNDEEKVENRYITSR